MLGVQPNHGWQLCFPLLLHGNGPDFRHYDGSDLKIVNEYDQEITQSQTADNPVAPQGRVAQPSRDTRKTN